MRPVNLLPAKYRPRVAGARNPRIAYITLGVLALLAVAVFGYVQSVNKVSSRNSEIAQVRQQITQAESQAVTLQGFGDFATIKETRLSAVKDLATARLDWERLFRELAHVLPDGVWLIGFDGHSGAGVEDGTGATGETSQTLALDGCADSHRQVADVMVRLRELYIAEDVVLTKTAASEDDQGGAAAPGAVPAGGGSSEGGCGPYYSFEIAVTLATPTPEPTATTAEPVPASLGGGG